MDRLTRKELKTDKFAEEIGQGLEFVSKHKADATKYGIAAAVVILLGGGWYFYSNYQQGVRQRALAEALKVDDAVVGQTQPRLPTFPNEAEKKKARTAAYSDVASKYHGTQEGAVAQMYLASALTDEAKYAEAEKIYKDVVDSAPKDYAAVAKVALGNVYMAEGKAADAEKILREVVDNPTSFVSKEEATIHLAEVLVTTKPEEARKLLEPLRTSRSVVSRSAIAVMAKLPQK